MGKTAVTVIYLLAMIVTVVGVDILIFRTRTLDRLLANIGIVLVFLSFYLRFLRAP